MYVWTMATVPYTLDLGSMILGQFRHLWLNNLSWYNSLHCFISWTTWLHTDKGAQ